MKSPGKFRRTVHFLAAACVSLLLSCGDQKTGSVEIPLPDFTRLDGRVRKQLQSHQAELDRGIADGFDANTLGKLYGIQGQLYLAYELEDAATACFVNAQRLLPQDYRWAYYLGHLYRRSGSAPESRRYYERTSRLNPRYLPSQIAVGELLIDGNHPDEAEDLLKLVLERDPHSARAMMNLARVETARGNHGDAVAYLEAARARAPEATRVNYLLGMAYRRLGEMDRARAFLKRQGRLEPRFDDPLLDDLENLVTGAHALVYRGNEAYLQQRYADALAAYEEAVSTAPENADFRVNLSSALKQIGDLRSAHEQIEIALTLNPTHAVANFNKATLTAREGRNEEAVTYYEKALTRDPSYKDAHFNLANAYLRLGRFEESTDHFSRVVELDPLNGTARYGEAVALIRMEAWSAAAERLEAGIAASPDHAQLVETVIRLLAACPVDGFRDGRRALQLAESLVGSSRTLGTVEAQAMALAEVGRFGEAVQLQEEALSAVHSADRDDLAVDLVRNLGRYRAGKPCRQPLSAPH